MDADKRAGEFITCLYEAYYGKLRTYCTAYVGGNRLFARDIEECVQDAFMAAYLKYGDLQNHKSIEGWLKKACSYRMRKVIKKRKQGIEPLLLSLDALPFDIEVQKIDPIDTYLAEIAQEELYNSIFSQLNENERHLIIDHWIKGKSIDELAKQHRTTVGTIKNKLFRVRKKLKSLRKNFLAP